MADAMRSDESDSDSDESLFEMDPSSDLENLYVLLSNVIGQLLDSNALRVLWISIYRVHVLKDLGTNLGAVDKFTCCKLLQIINSVNQVQERLSSE